MLALLLAALTAQVPPPLAKKQPALAVLTSGGGSAYLEPHICSRFSSYLSGNYACLDGDGTKTSAMTDGGTAYNLVTAGTPATDSRAVCPNGPNCSALSVQRLDGGSGTPAYWYTDGGENISGSFSACYCGTWENATKTVISKANPLEFYLFYNSSGRASFLVYGADAGNVQVNSALNIVNDRSRQSVCGVYSAGDVGALDGGMTVYVNGASSGTPSTAAHGRVYPGTGRVQFGRNGNSAALWTGAASNYLYTEKALTAAEVLAYDTACVGTVKGSYGEAITSTRTGTLWCESETGVLNPLPPNRECISRGAFWRQPSVKNDLASGTARDWTAGWTLTNMTAALTATGKDGVANTASTLTATADNATACQTVTAAAANRTTSLYIKRVTGTGAVSLSRDATTYTTLNRGYCYTPTGASAAPNTSAYVRCQLTSSVLNPQICLKLATNTDAVAVDFAQDEAQPVATAPNLAQATTGATITSLALPAAVGTGEGCVSARWYTPPSDLGQGQVGVIGMTSADSAKPLFMADQWRTQIYDGTNSAQATPTDAFAGRWVTGRASWNGSGIATTIDGVANTGSFDSAMGATSVWLGAYSSGSGLMAGWLGDVQVGATAQGCGMSLPVAKTKVLALGDSMSQDSAGRWHNYVVVDGEQHVQAAGVSGDTTTLALARWNSTWKAKAYPTVVVLLGTNDCRGDVAEATAYGNLKTIYDDVKAYGGTVIPVTVLPFHLASDATSAREECATTLNVEIKNYAADAGWTVVDAYAEFATDVGDGGFALDSGTGTTDGLHPGDTGYHVMAHMIQAVLP